MGLKRQIAIAAFLAILLAFLLAGISCVLFPSEASNGMPLPMSVASTFDLIAGALLWLGLAALITLTVVGAIMLTIRVRNKKTEKEETNES